EVEREADLDSVKKEFQAINDQAKIDTSFDPVGMVRDDITKAAADLDGAAAAKPEPGEAGQSEPGRSEIGRSEIALTGPEPAETAVPAETAPAPEASAVRRSAAE
ncbi:MAG TPA: hypothetical protein VN637_01990, partial [Roseiarcus sp.]|nr:hypothetical protein [Roseiarcus sp.]